MKTFAVLVDYPEDVLERRAPHRSQHLEYMEDLLADGRVLHAGPWADPVDGALLLYRADSVEEVEEILAGDPYTSAGLFDSRTIREWQIVVGSP